MAENTEEKRIAELDALRAPPRSELARRRTRDRTLDTAEPLLAVRRRPYSSLDVLAQWARPGLVAAAVVAAFLIGALQLRSGRGQAELPPVALEEVLRGENGAAVPALLLAASEPDADDVVAAVLLEDNGNGGN